MRVVCCLLFLLALTSSPHADILVINNRDALPYQEFVDGLKQHNPSAIQVANIGDNLEKIDELLQASTNQAVVGLTPQIAAYLQDKQVSNAYFSMISNVHAYNLSRLGGVELNASPEDYLATARKILPQAKHIGVIYSESNHTLIQQAKDHAQRHQFTLDARLINNTAEIDQVLESLIANNDAIWIINDPLVTRSAKIVREVILLKSIKANKPVFGLNKWAVKNGALFCLSADYQDLGQQLASLIQQNGREKEPHHDFPQNPKLYINNSMVGYFAAYAVVDIPTEALVLK